MKSSISSGGITHVRYGHFHYPRIMEFECPKCNSRLIGINEEVPESQESFIDIAPFHKNWKLICSYCDYRDDVDWIKSKELTLWRKNEIRGEKIWAWNRNHLNMILLKLRNEKLDSNSWKWFESYIPGGWLQKLRGEKELRKLEKLLEK